MAANADCNPTGVPGEGGNYIYWTDQAALLEQQAEQYKHLLLEKQKQLQQPSATPSRDNIAQRMSTVNSEIVNLRNELAIELEKAKKMQLENGSRRKVVKHGPIATSIATGKVITEASQYAQHSLMLLKAWFVLLEMSIFIARFSNAGKEYALALYRQQLERKHRWVPTIVQPIAKRIGE